ncbi:hypothetical protein AAHA92_05463 [Salvia divinorum]|uniref:Uncharacterized protein n=1 Tax=Salvia divinorum TaxID=28513 RepID=A0ABD1I6J6_SALDI
MPQELVGLGVGGLSNVTGIGGARGVSGSSISVPMGSGALTPQHAAYMKMKIGNQNRANMLGNLQSSTGGIPGARQMHPGSVFSMRSLATLNRANMSQMQHTTLGPPKQLQQLQQYQLKQPQQQLQHNNYSSIHNHNNKKQLHHSKLSFHLPKSDHLQAGDAPPYESTTAPANDNPEACPASSQLSSQTMGSVGSIANSPMELHGANKSKSVNNT